MWRAGFLHSTRIAMHDEFWEKLGQEVGPGECKDSDCTRRQISQSLYCKPHHFRQMMGEDYDGTRGA